MTRRFHLVADDYALSPAVSEGIRQLLASGRLSGTGCMTLFPEWPGEAERLRGSLPKGRAIGLHLTLTYFKGLTGFSLDGRGQMPGLPALIAAVTASRRHDAAIAAELDAQLEAFEAHWCAPPAYLDGHQHVHFLRPVRHWLAARAGHFAARSARPWLRGAPEIGFGETLSIRAKIGFVAALGRGFDRAMIAAGYPVRGPLVGFYPWRQPQAFAAALDGWLKQAPDGAVIMCHPGGVDDLLRRRDALVEARLAERDHLLSRDPLPLAEAFS